MHDVPWLLIVDDDRTLIDLLARVIQRDPAAATVEVETAATPTEALRIVAARCSDPLLVLSDYDLEAEIDGIALLGKIQELCPTSRRILYSGHPRAHIEPRLTPAVDAFFEKPDRAADLVAPILAHVLAIERSTSDVSARPAEG